ncbi:hypothetical protein HYPSUDRAFT_129787 [Hypholoma sublateritium FD-334 SS-4]|uniref:Carboxylic ester hydrolase n=1 Tax=Hypholoma sublateritium (strain FD-334 SS-4) TaxID=945553 RepID=A0A0D2LKL0_HYPSF|nr:hypothetical protein HYPSUDRAFT_129787 [Hypholoma sublateritium FD-334 SS-4]
MLTVLILTLSLLVGAYSALSVQVGNTNVIGRDIGEIEFFGGIPFAEPPLGELRLNFPVLNSTFNTKTFNAQNFGPSCLQTPAPPTGVSEDCLTLNVFRPSGIASEANLPVLVWIYGGILMHMLHFAVGGSSFYNATELVKRSVSRGTPILFVSINYRLGPLGFPQGIEAGQLKILNLGYHDQLTALQWIQENIGHFGGDKTKVIISGESAGAASIATFFLESRIKAFARGAIMESAALVNIFGPERNEANWQQYVAAVPECASFAGTNDTFACLRAASTVSLEQAIVATRINFQNISFAPAIDGPGGIVPARPSQIKPQGSLPTLFGTNLDEGTLFTPQAIDSAVEIKDMLSALVSPPIVSPEKLAATIARVLELYPDAPALGSPFGTGNATFGLSSEYKRQAAFYGDFVYQSSRRTLSHQISAQGIPVFAYLFTDHDAVTTICNAVPHTSEIPYVFGRLMNVTPRASALSTIMQDYWISFVDTLDPNDHRGSERPEWARYTPNNQVVLELNGQRTALVPDNYRAQQVAFLQDNSDALHR